MIRKIETMTAVAGSIKIEVANKWFTTFLESLKVKEDVKTSIIEMFEEYKDSHPIKKNKKKDPQAPKKPMNSFMFYCNEVRKTGTTVTQAGENWKTLSEKEKAKYVKKSEKDKERYEEEMKSYVPDEEFKKVEKVKTLKKKKSGWDMFCKENRGEYSGTIQEVTILLGKAWKELGNEEKKPYFKMADEFNEANPVIVKKKQTASDSDSKSKKSSDEKEDNKADKVKKVKKVKKVISDDDKEDKKDTDDDVEKVKKVKKTNKDEKSKKDTEDVVKKGKKTKVISDEDENKGKKTKKSKVISDEDTDEEDGGIVIKASKVVPELQENEDEPVVETIEIEQLMKENTCYWEKSKCDRACVESSNYCKVHKLMKDKFKK